MAIRLLASYFVNVVIANIVIVIVVGIFWYGMMQLLNYNKNEPTLYDQVEIISWWGYLSDRKKWRLWSANAALGLS